MKTLVILLSAAIVMSPLPVLSSEPSGPLTSGGAAGVKQAQGENTESTYLVAGIGAGVAIAIGILIALNNKDEPLLCFAGVGGGGTPTCPGLPFPPTTTTTTTTTTP